MSIADDLRESVRQHVENACIIVNTDDIPERDQVKLAAEAVQVEATALSIDIRQFSGLTNAFGRQVVVRMLRAFFEGSVRIVEGSSGTVADFNGDGMIVLFAGADRTERAFRAASQIRWFLTEVLRPRFAKYFESDQFLKARIEEFDAGCGLDDGLVLIGRVGSEGFNDIAWVGRCVNTAAKACKLAGSSKPIIATHEVYERLDTSTFAGTVNWVPVDLITVGGVQREVIATSYVSKP
ncbi:adenylate/guanylate cyclase domain-containing protein [Micromonospora sp. bgisy143]|uniref:adenylate/guanylate cyclase domain-containing protein n=1 Tax=Micromonospora sp. bgisy143 TaxID=3413790 RepID=UPI003EB7AA85